MGNGALAIERIFAEEDIEYGSGVVPFGPEVRVRHRDLVPIICFGAGRGELCACMHKYGLYTCIQIYVHTYSVCLQCVWVGVCLSFTLSL